MKRLTVVCVIIASALIAAPARASLVVLDQYNGYPYVEANPEILSGVGSQTKMAQTFTAGLTGILDHIEIGNTAGGVVWGPVSPPVVQIRETQGGQPVSDYLGSVIMSDPVPYDTNVQDNWLPVYFPQTISLTAGNMYSIVLWASSPGSVSVGATLHDYYSRGALWAYDENTWKLYTEGKPPVFDMQFRTYVVAVPLPAGISLGICAVSVAVWRLKRQMG